MKLKEVLSNLCYYDKRNPDCLMDSEEILEHDNSLSKEKRCYCDNCFRGKTILAEEILRLLRVTKIEFNCKVCLPTPKCSNCTKYKEPIRWRCTRCGRDKFTHKIGHRCGNNIRKHKLTFEPIYEI